jgi:hypothetical protein
MHRRRWYQGVALKPFAQCEQDELVFFAKGELGEWLVMDSRAQCVVALKTAWACECIRSKRCGNVMVPAPAFVEREYRRVMGLHSHSHTKSSAVS